MTPRDTARAWLTDPLSVVLDFETNGWVGYACEVAVIHMDGEVVIDTRIHPQVPIETSAAAVHGITLDALDSVPCFEEMRAQIIAAVRERNVIAYGAPFDRGVYGREMARLSPSPINAMVPLDWRCAMQLWQQHAGLRSTVKLETLVPTADHSALGDARACLEVVRRVAGYSSS